VELGGAAALGGEVAGSGCALAVAWAWAPQGLRGGGVAGGVGEDVGGGEGGVNCWVCDVAIGTL
jgi:hypothetical protein